MAPCSIFPPKLSHRAPSIQQYPIQSLVGFDSAHRHCSPNEHGSGSSGVQAVAVHPRLGGLRWNFRRRGRGPDLAAIYDDGVQNDAGRPDCRDGCKGLSPKRLRQLLALGTSLWQPLKEAHPLFLFLCRSGSSSASRKAGACRGGASRTLSGDS